MRSSGKTNLPLPFLLLAGAVSLATETGRASLITTLNFNSPEWSVLLTESNTAINASEVSIDGSTITADKIAPGSGGVRIQVSLTGSISTVGYENITLAFFGDADGDLDWNDPLSGPVDDDSDGLRISSNQGITIATDGLDDIAANETNFDNGSIFPNAGTAGFSSSDFTFAPSVDNSAITNLVFVLQVNANPETLIISNVQILGDAIIPEPSSALGFLGLMGVAFLRRRRRAVN